MNRVPRFLRFLAPWLLVGVVSGQQHPNRDRGFDPAKIYQFEEFEVVDLYNGHINLRIPLSPRYAVNEFLSYGLDLHYTSNLWHFEAATDADGHPCIFAEPRQDLDLDWNAGIGWSLSLGHLGYRNERWVFTSPDGGAHAFRSGLTRDGTYLRLTASTPTKKVEYPDGTFIILAQYGANLFRPVSIQHSGASGSLTVSYPNDNSWEVTDSHGRVSRVYFLFDDSAQPAVPRRYVDYAEVPAFSGKKLRVSFVYETRQINRSGKESCRHSWDPDFTVKVRLLKELVFREISGDQAVELYRWRFPSYFVPPGEPTGESEGKDLPGVLRKLVLPTGGEVEYVFTEHQFYTYWDNTACPTGDPFDPGCQLAPVLQFATAVRRRILRDPIRESQGYSGGNGTWTYRYYRHERDFGNLVAADETVTIVDDSAGNSTVFYFTPGVTDEGRTGAWFTGLPVTVLASDDPGSCLTQMDCRRLSVEWFSGPATIENTYLDACPGERCYPTGVRMRAEYRKYERDMENEGG